MHCLLPKRLAPPPWRRRSIASIHLHQQEESSSQTQHARKQLRVLHHQKSHDKTQERVQWKYNDIMRTNLQMKLIVRLPKYQGPSTILKIVDKSPDIALKNFIDISLKNTELKLFAIIVFATGGEACHGPTLFGPNINVNGWLGQFQCGQQSGSFIFDINAQSDSNLSLGLSCGSGTRSTRRRF